MSGADLNSKVALITGGAGGIGRAIAAALAAEGCRVILADLDGPAGSAAAEGVGGHFIAADLSQPADCRRLAAEAFERFGRLDILVNNAGMQHIDPIESFPEADWDRMLAVMLTAPFLLTKHLWPGMKAQGWGRVVNMASIHALIASPFKSAYTAAKHGLLGLTRATALEGGPLGITVNAICPAYVRTSLTERQIADQARTRGLPESEVIEKVMLEPAAIKRLIEPEEVAALVVYLCSPAGSAMTGAALTLDLGWTAR